MHMASTKALLAACTLLAGWQALAAVPGDGMAGLVGPNRLPAPAVLRDLDQTWFLVVVTSPAKRSDPMEADQTEQRVYTRGEMVSVSGRPMLLAYKTEPLSKPMASLIDHGTPDPSRLLSTLVPRQAPECPLAAVLINPATVRGIRVLRRFDLAKESGDRVDVGRKGYTTAIMAAILVPVFAQARLKARETSSVSNLKQIGLAIMMYSQDHDERLPNLLSLAKLQKVVAPYGVAATLLMNPVDGKPYVTNVRLSGKKLAGIRSPAACVLVWETSVGRDGKRAALFADGHVARIPADRWARILKSSVAR